jgi:hypothetical protein
MPTVVERLGSRTFDAGPGGGSGRLLFTVLDAADEDAAVALALSQPEVVPEVNGYLIDSWAVEALGSGNYNVDVNYRRGVPTAAGPAAGETPTAARPAPAGGNNDTPLGREVTVTTSGGTERIYRSRETRYRVGSSLYPEDVPPNFFGMIGYNHKEKKFEGCEVITASSDVTITKRFPTCTLGFFRHAMDLACSLNSEPYLGTDPEEMLYLGIDLSHNDADPDTPWTATGRFKYARNLVNVPVDSNDSEAAFIIVPEVKGHDYLWTMYKSVEALYEIEGVDVPVMVERPWFAYCERVYPLDSEQADGATLADLNLD